MSQPIKGAIRPAPATAAAAPPAIAAPNDTSSFVRADTESREILAGLRVQVALPVQVTWQSGWQFTALSARSARP